MLLLQNAHGISPIVLLVKTSSHLFHPCVRVYTSNAFIFFFTHSKLLKKMPLIRHDRKMDMPRPNESAVSTSPSTSGRLMLTAVVVLVDIRDLLLHCLSQRGRKHRILIASLGSVDGVNLVVSMSVMAISRWVVVKISTHNRPAG